MQFLAQEDPGGWFLAARKTYGRHHIGSQKAFPEHVRPKMPGRSHQGLEVKWGREVIKKSSTLTKSAIRSQLPCGGLGRGQGLASMAWWRQNIVQ